MVVVAHGGVINAYLREIIGASDDMFFHPAHASISRATGLSPSFYGVE